MAQRPSATNLPVLKRIRQRGDIRDSRQVPTSQVNPNMPRTRTGSNLIEYPGVDIGGGRTVTIIGQRRRHPSPNQQKAMKSLAAARRKGGR
jgi:hypothetical protein